MVVSTPEVHTISADVRSLMIFLLQHKRRINRTNPTECKITLPYNYTKTFLSVHVRDKQMHVCWHVAASYQVCSAASCTLSSLPADTADLEYLVNTLIC